MTSHDAPNAVPWWRQAQSLKLELALGFGVVIALTLVLGVVAYLSEQRSVSAVKKLLTIDNRMTDLSLRSAQAMLKARHAESSLLLAADELGIAAASERYAPLVQSSLDDMREYLSSIKILSTDPGMADKMRQIDLEIQKYEQGFLSVVDLSGKLRRTDSGEEEKLQQVGREIETLIKNAKQPALMAALLNLQQRENDFINHRQDAQMLLVLNSVAVLRSHLQARHPPAAENVRLASLLNDYAQTFQRYVEMVEAITAARRQYVQAALAIEPLLEAVHTTAAIRAVQTHDSVENAASSTRRTIILTAAIATILGAIIAFIVARRITGSVRQLIDFSKRVASGNLSARADQIAEHEFALLGNEMNKMAESIERSHVALAMSAAEMTYLATHDKLTGLPNRALLEDRLNQAMLFADRYDRVVMVAFIDLDHFKLVNDRLGHDAGDELLKAVATRMLQCLRSTDTVIRMGGDEFVIILFDQAKELDAVTPLLQKVCESIGQTVRLRGADFQVTCSMGVARYPGDGHDPATLLMNADTAMYRAKELGRNNFQVYTNTIDEKAH